MDKELEKKLVEKYPNLYSQYGKSPKETCMAWGFSCEAGWYNIIDELSSKLEPLGIVAAQVKEKFGGLRFYIEPTIKNGKFEKACALIREAESLSYETCEICGASGAKPRKGGWIRTLCGKCQDTKNDSVD